MPWMEIIIAPLNTIGDYIMQNKGLNLIFIIKKIYL